MDKIIQYQSLDLFYKTAGKGQTVVLVHGSAEDHSIWQLQVDYLQNHFRLIIPDLPGSGLSSFNPGLLTIDDYAGVINHILEEEEIDRCVLIGHSMGGYICLAFAEYFPAKLAALGLFHSSAYADKAEKIAARKKNIAFIQKNGPASFVKQSTPGLFSKKTRENHPGIVEEIIERYTNFYGQSLVSYQEAMIERPDRTLILENLTVPVLFVIGEEDTAVPLEDSLKQSHVPELSYIHILVDTSHMGMLEMKSYSNQILEKFLLDIK